MKRNMARFVPLMKNALAAPRVVSTPAVAATGRPVIADWVLGGVRESSQLHIQTARDVPSGAITARQYWDGAYTGHIAFAAASPAPSSYSGDRSQILGRNRSVSRPGALERAHLDNRTGVAMDPAVALQVEITLEKDSTAEVVFLLGQTETVEECRALLARYQTAAHVEDALGATRQWWDSVLGAVQVKTPLLSADLLLNRWLLYQVLSCRFWGRSAFYQSGGAIGFRDQLQDSLAMLYAAPQLTRAHIVVAVGVRMGVIVIIVVIVRVAMGMTVGMIMRAAEDEGADHIDAKSDRRDVKRAAVIDGNG